MSPWMGPVSGHEEAASPGERPPGWPAGRLRVWEPPRGAPRSRSCRRLGAARRARGPLRNSTARSCRRRPGVRPRRRCRRRRCPVESPGRTRSSPGSAACRPSASSRLEDGRSPRCPVALRASSPVQRFGCGWSPPSERKTSPVTASIPARAALPGPPRQRITATEAATRTPRPSGRRTARPPEAPRARPRNGS